MSTWGCWMIPATDSYAANVLAARGLDLARRHLEEFMPNHPGTAVLLVEFSSCLFMSPRTLLLAFREKAQLLMAWSGRGR